MLGPNLIGIRRLRLQSTTFDQLQLVLDRYDSGKRIGDGATGGLQPTFVTRADVVLPIIRLLANEQLNRDADRYAYFLEAFKESVEDVATCRHFPAWLTAAYDADFRLDRMQFTSILPDANISMSPIHPLRLVSSSVALELKRPRRDHESNCGFVAIDQARQLFLLSPTDCNVSTVPLIGIWVSGSAEVSMQDIANACARFIMNQTTIRKLDTGRRTMLLLLFTCAKVEAKPRMEFYECSYEIGKNVIAVFSAERTFDLDNSCPLRLYGLERRTIGEDIPLCDALESVMGVTCLGRKLPPVLPAQPTALHSEVEHSAPCPSESGESSKAEEAPTDLPEPKPSTTSASSNHEPEPKQINDERISCELAPKDPPPIQSSSLPAVKHGIPAEIYLALLQQQMDMILLQMSGGHAASAAAAEAPLGSATHLPAPRTHCDAATNTTMCEVRPTSGSPPPDRDPGMDERNTLGTADLEGALLRVNRTEIERIEQLPPDTGENYRPFFSQIGLDDEEEGVHEGNATAAQLVNNDADAVSVVEQLPQGEGPTAHLVRKVEQILATNAAQRLSRNHDAADECADLPPTETENEADEDASLLIARLASHPEQSFCLTPDPPLHTDSEGAETLPFMLFPRKHIVAESAVTKDGPLQAVENPVEGEQASLVEEFETIVDEEGYSLATLEYLKKYQLA
ncbi:hypothetical protein HDU86_006562 [Geranomyces michiganensis]|nr:hypothetical protein HDU86_006562 [Geranomyces michiganensis]